MTGAWTPGPWQFGKDRKWLFRDNQPQSMSSTTILVVDRSAFAPSEADAHLIAAAPELAEALESLVGSLTIDPVSAYAMSFLGGGVSPEDMVSKVQAARAALSKAKGQSV